MDSRSGGLHSHTIEIFDERGIAERSGRLFAPCEARVLSTCQYERRPRPPRGRGPIVSTLAILSQQVVAGRNEEL
jgi:hypothetical protein